MTCRKQHKLSEDANREGNDLEYVDETGQPVEGRDGYETVQEKSNGFT